MIAACEKAIGHCRSVLLNYLSIDKLCEMRGWSTKSDRNVNIQYPRVSELRTNLGAI